MARQIGDRGIGVSPVLAPRREGGEALNRSRCRIGTDREDMFDLICMHVARVFVCVRACVCRRTHCAQIETDRVETLRHVARAWGGSGECLFEPRIEKEY